MKSLVSKETNFKFIGLMNRQPVKSMQSRRDMITKLKTKNSSSKRILHKNAMKRRIGKRIVERVTVIKVSGGKRISRKDSSFQIKRGANLAKKTNGVIRALTDRRNFFRERKIRTKGSNVILVSSLILTSLFLSKFLLSASALITPFVCFAKFAPFLI